MIAWRTSCRIFFKVTVIHDAHESLLDGHLGDDALGLCDTARRSAAESAVADASVDQQHSCAAEPASAECTGAGIRVW